MSQIVQRCKTHNALNGEHFQGSNFRAMWANNASMYTVMQMKLLVLLNLDLVHTCYEIALLYTIGKESQNSWCCLKNKQTKTYWANTRLVCTHLNLFFMLNPKRRRKNHFLSLEKVWEFRAVVCTWILALVCITLNLNVKTLVNTQ